jgi:hypothetical protein
MASASKCLINVVILSEPKMLTGSCSNEHVVGTGAPTSPVMGKQHHRRIGQVLTHLVREAEHGKPVFSPQGKARPQGPPMGRRVKDDGESEDRAVMARIGVEKVGYQTLCTLPLNITPRESEQTSVWLPSRESRANRSREECR